MRIACQDSWKAYKPHTRCTRETDPEDWELFKDYCKQDVVAEREIYKRLIPFNLSPEEWSDWHMDVKINQRGLPVDIELAEAALELEVEEKARLMEQLKTLTGLDNPNSVAQFLPWCQERGYPYDSLNKEFVNKFLKEAKGC